jgi:hypothetical protein
MLQITVVLTVTIQFNTSFIYVLSSTANGQLQSQNEYRQQQYDSTRQNKEKNKEK